ncbi:MAG: hypothetical protein AAGE96_20810 [Cyanobacteria bacterium P01_G01_bin.19]
MEDMMFGLVLFVVYYIFLVWLYAPAVESSEGAWEVNESGEIVHHNEILTVPTVKPIEQQLKDVLWSSDEEVTETVTEVEHQPTVEELLDGVEIDKITLRKARKIASALGIKQKVNGRDQPKKWIVAQIAKKLKANPIEVAPIIIKQVRAA